MHCFSIVSAAMFDGLSYANVSIILLINSLFPRNKLIIDQAINREKKNYEHNLYFTAVLVFFDFGLFSF